MADERPAFLAQESTNGTWVRVLPDTGANMCFASEAYLAKIGHPVEDPTDAPEIVIANGDIVQSVGSTHVELELGPGGREHLLVKVYAFTMPANSALAETLVLGHDALAGYLLDVTHDPPLIPKSQAALFLHGTAHKPAAFRPPT